MEKMVKHKGKLEPRPEKIAALQVLAEKLKKSKATVITDYRGMTVEEVSNLRRQLRRQKIEYKVVKNTLFVKALKQAGISGLDEFITGPVAVAFAENDPVAPAKILFEFSEEVEKPKIRAGLVESKLADEKLLADLAKLPSREVLIAKVVGGIKSPLQGLVFALSGMARKLVYVLDAVKKQKEAQG